MENKNSIYGYLSFIYSLLETVEKSQYIFIGEQ